MARKRRHEEHENHERWLVSYADFITLLFAFFVVMYSVSSVNEGKMRVLSDTLVANFPDRQKSLEPIQAGELVRSPVTDEVSSRTTPLQVQVPLPPIPDLASDDQERGLGEGAGFDVAPSTGDPPPEQPPPALAGTDAALLATAEPVTPEPVTPEPATAGQDDNAPMASLGSVATEMQSHLQSLVDQGLVDVRRQDRWIEVELSNSILFGSGEARLSNAAVPVLAEMASVLKSFPNPIQVEGFTDNVPISTLTYPSNWELSAARAASVVHLFMKYGVRPERMVAIGYGEHRAIASNDDAEGRGRNRRVVLIIAADRETRRVIDLDRDSAGVAPREVLAGASSPPGRATQ